MVYGYFILEHSNIVVMDIFLNDIAQKTINLLRIQKLGAFVSHGQCYQVSLEKASDLVWQNKAKISDWPH